MSVSQEAGSKGARGREARRVERGGADLVRRAFLVVDWGVEAGTAGLGWTLGVWVGCQNRVG